MECVFRFFWLKSDDLKNTISGEWMESFTADMMKIERHRGCGAFLFLNGQLRKSNKYLEKLHGFWNLQRLSKWGFSKAIVHEVLHILVCWPLNKLWHAQSILVGLACFHEAVFVWDRQLECVIAWFISQNTAVVLEPFAEAWHLDENNSFILHARRFIEEGEDWVCIVTCPPPPWSFLIWVEYVFNQSFPPSGTKITTCPENGFTPKIISFCLLNISSAAPTGTGNPKRCKWHHPWENPSNISDKVATCKLIQKWKSFWKTVLLLPNPELFSIDTVLKPSRHLDAAGGDDQLLKPNRVENAYIAPTRAFAKYQGSGFFGGWYSPGNETVRPYPTFHGKAGKPSTQVKCWLVIWTRFLKRVGHHLFFFQIFESFISLLFDWKEIGGCHTPSHEIHPTDLLAVSNKEICQHERVKRAYL